MQNWQQMARYGLDSSFAKQFLTNDQFKIWKKKCKLKTKIKKKN